MEIVDNRNEAIQLKNINDGTVFEYGNSFFIKTNALVDDDSFIGCVSLRNGMYFRLEKTKVINPIKDVKLVIGK